MSIVLPQDLKTSKVESLDADLRDIAESLIAEKFDVREEVEPLNWVDSFRQELPGNQRAFKGIYVAERDVFIDPADISHGYRDDIRVEYEPWSRNRIATLRVREPSNFCLTEVLTRLDAENIRHNREIIMDKYFLNEILRDMNFGMMFKQRYGEPVEGASNVIGEIYGMPIVVANVSGCIIRATI